MPVSHLPESPKLHPLGGRSGGAHAPCHRLGARPLGTAARPACDWKHTVNKCPLGMDAAGKPAERGIVHLETKPPREPPEQPRSRQGNISAVTANFFLTLLRLGRERVCGPYLAAATQRITLAEEMHSDAAPGNMALSNNADMDREVYGPTAMCCAWQPCPFCAQPRVALGGREGRNLLPVAQNGFMTSSRLTQGRKLLLVERTQSSKRYEEQGQREGAVANAERRQSHWRSFRQIGGTHGTQPGVAGATLAYRAGHVAIPASLGRFTIPPCGIYLLRRLASGQFLPLYQTLSRLASLLSPSFTSKRGREGGRGGRGGEGGEGEKAKIARQWMNGLSATPTDVRALQGTCSNDEVGGKYVFLTSSGDRRPVPPCRRLRATGVTHNYPRI
ncbi:unnamed protein product [Pleuronectes platessa]|uniref:Uncharacterized protein n=1 Tax=Pleuronectes platessa TaxID=8262 RepID=A0A9N7YE77_PLEPL|nr:unnamed protein product [Pleuronectes platessa]